MKRLTAGTTSNFNVPDNDQIYGLNKSQVAAIKKFADALRALSDECDDPVWGDWFNNEILAGKLNCFSRSIDEVWYDVIDLIEE